VAYPGTAQFFWSSYYLMNGKSYGFQIWPVYSEGPSEQKPIKNFREKAAWAYRGTAQFFRVLPIISGTGKATHFKFGQYIQRVHHIMCGRRICTSYIDTVHRQKCQANPDPNPNPNPTNPNPSRATTRRHSHWFGWAMHRINV